MNFKPKNRDEFSLDITPLIDVVFLLLIFFMVSTTFKDESEINITLPNASNEIVDEKPNAINIGLDLFGQANGLYDYASQLDQSRSSDQLAFTRNEREFFNHQLTEQALKEFLGNILASYKIPQKIVFLDEIPKGKTGKLQRIGLAKKLGLEK